MKSKAIRKLHGAVILVLTLCFTLNINADNWPVGSGGKPTRAGLSTESGPETSSLLWQNGVNAVIAQQAVIEGNVVAMSRISNISNVLHGTYVVAQDLTTGDTLWTKDLPVDFPSTDWRNRVSAINNGQVYATRSGNTNYSYMYALDADDGSIVWKSEDLVNESSTESCAFADNGDLIVGSFDNILRIDATDGTTVWQTTRSTPTSNGQEVSVFDGKGYYWEPSPAGPKVSVIDLETGNYLYSSDALSAGLIQQLGLFIGPDGTIYAPRSMNNASTDFLYALKDNGSGFEILWSTPIGYIPFSTSAVGPDGTIYTYSQAGEVMRLDPADGSVLNTSQIIFSSVSASPRMAIDINGYVFVTNGEFATGEFFSFNPDLSLRWSEPVTNVNIGGPAIGENGTLVICGVGADVRAYEGSYSLQAIFSADQTEICEASAVQFTDQSNGNVTSWNWTFEGGTPAISSDENPLVSYPTAGTFDVTLEVSDGTNSSSLTLMDYITVNDLPVVSFGLLPDYFCLGYDPYLLVEGTPEGGVYFGPGVIDSYFYPDTAGLGNHTIYYYFEDTQGCGDTASQMAMVVICDGIKEAGTGQFRISPNPANDFIELSFENFQNHTDYVLKIIDPVGRLVYHTSIKPKEQALNVDVRLWPAGIYSVIVSRNGEVTGGLKLMIK